MPIPRATRLVGSFDQLAVDEEGAGTDQGDEVVGDHQPPGLG